MMINVEIGRPSKNPITRTIFLNLPFFLPVENRGLFFLALKFNNTILT